MKKSTAIERTPARRMTTSSQSSSNNQYRHTMQKIETNSQIDDAYKLKRLRNNNVSIFYLDHTNFFYRV